MAEINVGEISEALNNKVDLDCNNLSETGVNRFDGEWVYPETTRLITDASINGSTDLEFDLTEILPKDNSPYECILSAGCLTGTTIGNTVISKVYTPSMSRNFSLTICGCVTHANVATAVGNATIVIGTDRKLFL